jgi:hypothetical protein
MIEKRARPKDPVAKILQRLSDILPKGELEIMDDIRVAQASFEIYATPEEGQRLIHLFVRIKQPELRAGLIKIAARMAEVKN